MAGSPPGGAAHPAPGSSGAANDPGIRGHANDPEGAGEAGERFGSSATESVDQHAVRDGDLDGRDREKREKRNNPALQIKQSTVPVKKAAEGLHKAIPGGFGGAGGDHVRGHGERSACAEC